MTGRLAFASGTLLAAWLLLASCAPPAPGATEGGGADGASGTGITIFGDARLGVAYGADEPGGRPRTRLVAE